MENNQNEEKVRIKENLKSLDRKTRKTLFNVIVVSACGIFFVAIIIYLSLTQPDVVAKFLKPTVTGPIMPPIVSNDFFEKTSVVNNDFEFEYPVYRGEKVDIVNPVYRGEPVEITLLSK